MWIKICRGLFAVCCMGVMSHSFADDDSTEPLKGVYRGTGTVNCLESQGGFTPNLQFQVNGFAARYTDTFVSTAVFHGDGTMTETVRGTTFFQGDPYIPGAFGAGTFVSTCRITLSMNANKSFTTKGSCSGNLPLGPAAGLSVSVDGVGGQGQVSENNSMIIIGNSEPQAQTLTLGNGYVARRLCAGTATYVRVEF
jgi:hypothetical protein